MYIAYVVIGSLLSLTLLASAYAKLTRNARVVDSMTSIGVPLRMFPFLAACEIAGAVGLLIGLGYAPLGVAAAIGLVLYFVLACGAHLRKGDFKGLPSALVILVFSAVVLGLRIATL